MATRAAVAGKRNVLLEQHVGLVHHVARHLAARLSDEAELDELVSAGTIGLVQAAESFDSSRGLSFSTYAVPRIRGAVLDELRKQDHVPRNVRRRARDVTRARETLAATLRRPPTHQEVSETMGISADMLRRWELDGEAASLRSLDQGVRSETPGATLGETIADDRSVSFDDAISHEQEVEHLNRAILGLKEQERTVLALNFFEELKLHEIARVMNLSVCRISQIRTAALGRLRRELAPLRAA
ncbi:MAG TPA: FliA/WhiG family RNA polymerase sigma factor [Gemmatimonadaceae bacterium]|nr:FliA/WhiG family RNA polymerase sigma factor [Gemmatimonadaceae bacterium]